MSKINTAQSIITYSALSPELKSLKLYYNNHSDTSIDLLNTTKTPYISFDPGVPFTFTVDFSNKDQIEDVYIISTRNNEKRYIEATYNSKKGIYVASGYFDDTNHSYVPGKISVGINKKREPTIISSNVTVDTSNISSAMRKTKVTQIPTSNSYEQKYRFDITDTLIDVGKDVEKTYVDIAVSQFDNASDMNVGEYLGLLEAIKTGAGYFIKDENGDNWFTKADWSDVNTYTVLAKDVTGTSNKIVKFILSTQGPGEWGTLNEIAPYLGLASTGFSTAVKLQGFKGEYEDLTREIMMNSNIKDKQGALKKAENLYNDQYKYTVMMAVIPLLAATMGLPASVAIGFSALCGIIEASSQFFWKARVPQGEGQQLSLRWAIDPSGYVYEGVTSNRISDVAVTAYYKENLKDQNAVLWDASEYDQVNPLVTGKDGAYAWDVPEGYWQVKCEKQGYETAYSEWLEVPPPQTNVNIRMIPSDGLEVSTINVYNKYVEVMFNQYVDPELVDGIVLKDSSGNVLSYTLNYSFETDEKGNTYAKSYRLNYDSKEIDEGEKVNIFVPDSIVSADHKACKSISVDKICEKEISIDVSKNISIAMGDTVSIPIIVMNYYDGCVFEAISDSIAFVSVKNSVTISSDGSGFIIASGELYGNANISLKCNGKVVADIPVKVTDLTDIGHAHVPMAAVRENERAAQCTQNGSYEEVVYCSECGVVLRRENKIIPMTGHKWNKNFTTDKAPTKKAEGVKSIHCSQCNARKNITTIPPTEDSNQNIKKGTILIDKKSKAQYKVTVPGTKNGSVEYKKSLNTKATAVTIPATITVKNITYNVKAIASNAFKGNKRLKKVTIRAKVATIGSNAFKGCTALKKITIPASVKKIGKSAFAGCKRLRIIIIKTSKLTSSAVGKGAFKGVDSRAVIRVPKKKLAAYKKILVKRGISGKNQKIRK